jgi:hypothetical protein
MFLQKGDDIWKERRVGENLACFSEDIFYFIGIVTYFVFYQRTIELQRAQAHVQVRRKDSVDRDAQIWYICSPAAASQGIIQW